MPDDESEESTSGILFFHSHLIARGLPTRMGGAYPEREIYCVTLIHGRRALRILNIRLPFRRGGAIANDRSYCRIKRQPFALWTTRCNSDFRYGYD